MTSSSFYTSYLDNLYNMLNCAGLSPCILGYKEMLTAILHLTIKCFFLFCRPSDRSGKDVEIIFSRLKNVAAFDKYHPILLEQLCYYGYYEDLECGVTRKLFSAISLILRQVSHMLLCLVLTFYGSRSSASRNYRDCHSAVIF